jgi:hypothetical protein
MTVTFAAAIAGSYRLVNTQESKLATVDRREFDCRLVIDRIPQ